MYLGTSEKIEADCDTGSWELLTMRSFSPYIPKQYKADEATEEITTFDADLAHTHGKVEDIVDGFWSSFAKYRCISRCHSLRSITMKDSPEYMVDSHCADGGHSAV